MTRLSIYTLETFASLVGANRGGSDSEIWHRRKRNPRLRDGKVGFEAYLDCEWQIKVDVLCEYYFSPLILSATFHVKLSEYMPPANFHTLR